MKKITYILVHGAWHNSFCWHKVSTILKKYGHHVLALDYSKKLSNCYYNFDSYSDDNILNILGKNTENNVIFVGHSIGAAVVNSICSKYSLKSIKKIIYISGCIPKNGNAISSIFSNKENKTLLTKNFIILKKGKYIGINQKMIDKIFYNKCKDKKEVAIYKNHIVAQSLQALRTPIYYNQAALKSIPIIYVKCSEDNVIDIKMQENICNNNNIDYSSIIRINSDHSPFYSEPELLSKILLSKK